MPQARGEKQASSLTKDMLTHISAIVKQNFMKVGENLF